MGEREPRLNITPEMRAMAQNLSMLSPEQRAWVIAEAEQKQGQAREGSAEENPAQKLEKAAREIRERLGEIITPLDLLGEMQGSLVRNHFFPPKDELEQQLEAKLALIPGDDYHNEGVRLILSTYEAMQKHLQDALSVFYDPENNLSPEAEPLQRAWRQNFLPLMADYNIRVIARQSLINLAEESNWSGLKALEEHLLESWKGVLKFRHGGLAEAYTWSGIARNFSIYTSTSERDADDKNYRQTKTARLIFSAWRNTPEIIKATFERIFQGATNDIVFNDQALWLMQLLRALAMNEAISAQCPDLRVQELDQAMQRQGYVLEQGIYHQPYEAGKSRDRDPARLQFQAGLLLHAAAEPLVQAVEAAIPEQKIYEIKKRNEQLQAEFRKLDVIGKEYAEKYASLQRKEARLQEINRLLAEKSWGMKKIRGEAREQLEREAQELNDALDGITALKEELAKIAKQAEPYKHLLKADETFAEVAKEWEAHKALMREMGSEILSK